MSSKNKSNIKKQSEIVQKIKETQTLDKKHKEIVNLFNNKKDKEKEIIDELYEIEVKLRELS
jgi:hypothetical protein